MGGLPEDMDCSLLGSDDKAGTVPMAVVPFSNRMYIYVISSSLFAIFCYLYNLILLFTFKRIKIFRITTIKTSKSTNITRHFYPISIYYVINTILFITTKTFNNYTKMIITIFSIAKLTYV